MISKTVRLFIKSAFVRTCISGIVDSTKYLFPTAPKTLPIQSVILDSNLSFGIKNTKNEITNERKAPKNSLK